MVSMWRRWGSLSGCGGLPARLFACSLIALSTAFLFAAEAPLENTGSPMRVAFACAGDDLQAAGLSCNEDEPCRILLELSAVETSAGRVFLAGNLHTTATTLSSILLVTEDNGRTWREAYRRIPYAALDQIQFVDFQHGWISGQNVQSLARDPFLLATDDGGVTWREQPIFGEAQEAGAIQRFHFDSVTTGMLLLDRGAGKRYELYRTASGGMTWDLVRADRDPIPFPGGPPSAATSWRIRADAKTSAWLIEQNRGDIWQRIAAFSTEAAVCR
jgi:hypothetical protein